MISNLFKSIIIKGEYFHIFMNVAAILIIHGIYGDCYALSIVPMERQFIIPDSVHRGTEIEDTVFSHELDEIVFTQKKKATAAREKIQKAATQKTNVVERLMASVVKQRKIAVKKKQRNNASVINPLR